MDTNKHYRKLINTRRWQSLRNERIAAARGLCERCAADDRTTIATEVHHVQPVEMGVTAAQMKALCYNYNNLQALCAECHKLAHSELNSYTKEGAKERAKAKTDHFVNTFLKPPERTQ